MMRYIAIGYSRLFVNRLTNLAIALIGGSHRMQ